MSHFRAIVASLVIAWLVLLSPGSRAQSASPLGELDCLGHSAIEAPIKPRMTCTDFLWRGEYGPSRGYDNGHYVGHDEPSVTFVSTQHQSGSDVRWELTLPQDRPVPAVQTFELTPAIWFALALCDPKSYPNGACIPASDENTPALAGSAVLEVQLYPPGFPPFVTQFSCDLKHWCAALTIDSLEVTSKGALNPNCTEPVNFAFIQRDGVPTGPPGPATATLATFTPNSATLLMNAGDRLRVTTKDTGAGLLVRIEDLTTGQSGYMVASGANGFQNTDPNTCKGSNFNFRPEFDSAKFGNFVPWAALEVNVTTAFEIGHFEPGTGNYDSDDPPCFPGPTVPGCIGEDLDYDGTSYLADWPDGSSRTATPVRFEAAAGTGIGPASHDPESSQYDRPYPISFFETDVNATDPACQPSGEGCAVPPPHARFYPYWSVQSTGSGADMSLRGCTLLFGNMSGSGIIDFGRDLEYGAPNLPWFFATNTSGPMSTPCYSPPDD
jgi:hypothetical protein